MASNGELVDGETTNNVYDTSTITFQATHMLPRGLQPSTDLPSEIDSWNWIKPPYINAINRESGSSKGGWAVSALRTALQEGGFVYNKFNSSFTSDIESVNKYTETEDYDHSGTKTSDKFFILSVGEHNSEYYENLHFGKREGSQYMFWASKLDWTMGGTALKMFTRAGNEALCYSFDGSSTTYTDWFQRSSDLTWHSYFHCVTNEGVAYNHGGKNAGNAGGVVPAFCF